MFREDEPILDTSVYHTQQCAEKALKGYLAFKKQPIQKTHDLAVLVEICGQLDAEFREFIDDAATLGPYCDAFRYPGNQDEPETEDAADAIARAEKFFRSWKAELRPSLGTKVRKPMIFLNKNWGQL